MEKPFEISFPEVEMDIFNPCFKGVRGLFGNPKALNSLLFYLRTLSLFFSAYSSLSSTLTTIVVQLVDTKGTTGKYPCVIHLECSMCHLSACQQLGSLRCPRGSLEPVVVAGTSILLFYVALRLLRMNSQPGKG